MSKVIVVENDANFGIEFSKAGKRLVVIDFTATWCGPCRKVSPIFDQMAIKYPNALLLKVDVDKCPDTSKAYSISAMPTFLFFRNLQKIDSHRGGEIVALEEKIKKWYSDEAIEGGDTDVGVKGCMDLSSLINAKVSECLNESDDHTLAHALSSAGGFLQSDCDEQIIISIHFNQPVKLHSFKLHGPSDMGPKKVKLFANQPNTLTFDQAENMESSQQFELKPQQITEEAIIPLKFVKFQNVQNFTLYVSNNQCGGEITQIDYIGFLGSPLNSTTNMAEFKRVSGKAGESHS